MHDFCNSVGVQLAFPPEKESWAHGSVEAAIQDVKMTATAIQTSSPEQNPEVTLYLAAAALNSTEYTRGFSSFQWCFGKAYNITEEDIRTFEQLPQDQRHREFEQLAQARQKAEDIARSTRAKRVLSKLVNTTVRQPLRTFQPMDLVKVWRRVWPAELHRGARQGLKKSGKPHWIGPGRVIFHEVLPHQQADDDRRHVVWVLIGTQLMRCSPHSVRLVTDKERLVFEIGGAEDPSRWRSLADVLPKREFVDMIDQAPKSDELEHPDLPPEPDKSTIIKPTHRMKTKGALNIRPVPMPKAKVARTGEPEPSSSAPSSTSTAMPTHSAPPAGEVNEYEEDPDLRRELKKARITPDDALWIQSLQEETIDLHTALMDTEQVMVMEFNLEFTSNREKKNFIRDPHLFLVKQMRSSEVNLKKLTPQLRELFHRAKAKEVSSFLKNEAVRKCLDNKEIQEAYNSGRIMRARWVLTWKLVPDEEHLTVARKQRPASWCSDLNTPIYWTLPSAPRVRFKPTSGGTSCTS